MVVSTISNTGTPRSRFVLLKSFSDNGFIFFTNLNSGKGKELKKNPHASLLFYWHEIHRQVRIEGTTTPVSRKQVEEYFYSRPLGSQIAAVVSAQSEELSSRAELINKFNAAEKNAQKTPPLCPKHWGGFIVKANFFEFWSGMPSRLHDRMSYEKKGTRWIKKRLYP